MRYVINIEYDHAEIGCNPGPLEVVVDESKRGVRRLAKHLQRLFGGGNVELWRDVTQETYEKIEIGGKDMK